MNFAKIVIFIIIMDEISYLSTKKCACCLKRLDTIPKRGITRAKDDDNFLICIIDKFCT